MAGKRLITGVDANGKSTFIFDDTAANTYVADQIGGVAMSMIWQTHSAPASNTGSADAAEGPWKLMAEAGSGGSTFQIVVIPPHADKKNVPSEETYNFIGGDTGVASDVHHQMHKTTTIDYIVIIEGEIYAVMEAGERHMKAGDVLVQRGTVHHWVNRSERPCRFAAILIDAVD
jgi:quercetin dioxygenase-like cupin family protein